MDGRIRIDGPRRLVLVALAPGQEIRQDGDAADGWMARRERIGRLGDERKRERKVAIK